MIAFSVVTMALLAIIAGADLWDWLSSETVELEGF